MAISSALGLFGSGAREISLVFRAMMQKLHDDKESGCMSFKPSSAPLMFIRPQADDDRQSSVRLTTEVPMSD